MDDSTWGCASCSTVNPATGSFCVVCGTARAKPTGTDGGTGDPVEGPTVPVVPLVRAESMAEPTPVFGRIGGGAPASSRETRTGSDGPASRSRSSPRSGSSDRTTTALAVVALVLLACVAGLSAFLLVGRGGSGSSAPSGPDRVAADARVDADELREADEPTATSARPETTEIPRVTASTEPREERREARLWASYAKLRTEAGMGGEDTVMRELRGEGLPVVIIGELDRGWYEVEVGGDRGHLYAGLVTPPPPGFCLVSAGEGENWASDSVFGSARLLVREERDSDGRWRVIRPDRRETSERLHIDESICQP